MKLLFILLMSTLTLVAQEEFSISYFEDSSTQQTLEQIIVEESTSYPIFKPLEKFNFGSTKANIWLKIIFNNNTNDKQKRIFEFQDNRLDRIKIYENRCLVNTIGDMLPYSNRTIKSPAPTHKFVIDANTQATYYLCISNNGVTDLRYKIYTPVDYMEFINAQNLFYAFYYGATSMMILYNLILFFFIRERVFLYYVVYHVSLTVAMFYFNGLIMANYTPDEENLNLGNVPLFASGFTVLMAMQFARSYLKTEEVIPKFDRYILFFMGLHILSIIVSIVGVIDTFNLMVASINRLVSSLFLFYVSIHLIIINKSESAKFYFIGWGIMLLAVLMTSFISLGIVPRTQLTSYIFQVSSLFELLLLSMGLAYRYSEQQKIIYNHEENLKFINKNLENTIKVRTEELDKEVLHTKALLKDKEILFKELYHRVKNNLQMMVSILSMQKRRVDDIKVKNILDNVTMRIKSLALIHEQLQTSSELESIDMKVYLISLLNQIKKSYQVISVELIIKSESIYMNIDQVSSVGLIVNELVNNSFKHAFAENLQPMITLSLFENDKKEYQMEYSDNGQGSDSVKDSKSLGSLIISTLTKGQLKGEMVINTKPSVAYIFTFSQK